MVVSNSRKPHRAVAQESGWIQIPSQGTVLVFSFVIANCKLCGCANYAFLYTSVSHNTKSLFHQQTRWEVRRPNPFMNKDTYLQYSFLYSTEKTLCHKDRYPRYDTRFITSNSPFQKVSGEKLRILFLLKWNNGKTNWMRDRSLVTLKNLKEFIIELKYT